MCFGSVWTDSEIRSSRFFSSAALVGIEHYTPSIVTFAVIWSCNQLLCVLLSRKKIFCSFKVLWKVIRLTRKCTNWCSQSVTMTTLHSTTPCHTYPFQLLAATTPGLVFVRCIRMNDLTLSETSYGTLNWPNQNYGKYEMWMANLLYRKCPVFNNNNNNNDNNVLFSVPILFWSTKPITRNKISKKNV